MAFFMSLKISPRVFFAISATASMGIVGKFSWMYWKRKV